jgi:hypothetical protein
MQSEAIEGALQANMGVLSSEGPLGRHRAVVVWRGHAAHEQM